jgi:hypothetical protein
VVVGSCFEEFDFFKPSRDMLKMSILVGVRGSWVASVATARSPKTGFRHRLVGVQAVQLHDDEAVRKGGNDPPETGPTPPVPPVSALD